MQRNCTKYLPSESVDFEDKNWLIKLDQWRSSVVIEITNGCFGSIKPLSGCRQKEDVLKMREVVMEYVNSDIGSMPWQTSRQLPAQS